MSKSQSGNLSALSSDFLRQRSRLLMIIHKTHPSSFTGTTLHNHLIGLGKTKIVLVGYMAHNCISSTSKIGAEMGYDVLVVRDAIGDRDVPGATARQLIDVVLAELGDVYCNQ